MSIWKILKSWILTIGIGSFLSQIIFESITFSTTDGSWEFIIDDILSYTLITMIVSSLLSIPTILILIIVNENLKKRNADIQNIDKQLTITQLICGFITFAILFIGTEFNDLEDILVIAIAFLSTGFLIWKKEIKKLATTTVHRQ